MTTNRLRGALLRLAVFLAALGAATALGVSGCADANGTVSGGDALIDGAPPPPAPCILEDAGPEAPPPTGISWAELYRDLFGTSGKGNCANPALSCHGTAQQAGAKASLFICGTSEESCYTGITNKDAELVDPSDDPPSTLLYSILRKRCGGGSMPDQPRTVSFTPSEMDRIAAWIRAGSPRN